MDDIFEMLDSGQLESGLDEEEHYELSDEYPVYSDYVDSDGVVFISENRKVANFDRQTSIQGESDAQYIVFEMSRYYNGIDLSKKNIQVHYERPDGEGDNMSPVNVLVSDTKIRFGWIIPSHATELSGKLKIMPFVFGDSVVQDSEVYIMKSLYVEYVIHVGLSIDGGLKKKDDEWYQQFLLDMLRYVQEVREIKKQAEKVIDEAEQIKVEAGVIKDDTEKIHVHIIELVESVKDVEFATDEIKGLRDEARVSEENAKKYADEARNLVAGVSSGAIVPYGTITFSDLPDTAGVGAMYNISDAFVSDERFTDGAGIKYKEGTNVYYTAQGKWDVLVSVPYTKEDLGLSKVENKSPEEIADLVTKESLGLEKVENKTSTEILREMSKEDVTNALGYTPPQQDTNTTYSVMKGASANAAGSSGLVPAPPAGKTNRYLSAAGTFDEIEVPDVDIPNDAESYNALPVKYVDYTTSNKQDALNKINNPNLLFGNNKNRSYCIMFNDGVGDSPLGGGISQIIGHIYSSGSYGFQMAVKHVSGTDRFRVRNLLKDVWSEWASIYDTENKPSLSDLGAASSVLVETIREKVETLSEGSNDSMGTDNYISYDISGALLYVGKNVGTLYVEIPISSSIGSDVYISFDLCVSDNERYMGESISNVTDNSVIYHVNGVVGSDGKWLNPSVYCNTKIGSMYGTNIQVLFGNMDEKLAVSFGNDETVWREGLAFITNIRYYINSDADPDPNLYKSLVGKWSVKLKKSASFVSNMNEDYCNKDYRYPNVTTQLFSLINGLTGNLLKGSSFAKGDVCLNGTDGYWGFYGSLNFDNADPFGSCLSFGLYITGSGKALYATKNNRFLSVSKKYKVSVWMKTSSGSRTVRIRVNNSISSGAYLNCSVNSEWQLFSFVTTSFTSLVTDKQLYIEDLGTTYNIFLYIFAPCVSLHV